MTDLYDIKKAFRSVFNSPDGKVVMGYLKEEYDQSTTMTGDPMITYGNSCKRDDLLDIIEMSEDKIDE